jgi:hypothetical protein
MLLSFINHYSVTNLLSRAWVTLTFCQCTLVLVSLESSMSLSPTTNTHGEFSVSAEGQGHVPLPRVRVVTFLRDKYKSVMSTSRQTNGTYGCLMSPQQVCYHLLFARRPRRGLVLTNKQTLRLKWARIHLRFTKA